MLQPAKTKYRKHHRGRSDTQGKALKGSRIAFGSYALKAVSRGEINSKQIESARKAITHAVKRGGKVWIRIFPHKSLTKKPAEVPMGSGKGSVELYVSNIKPGRILFEMDGVGRGIARKALSLAAYKLPVRTKIVEKEK